MTIGIAFSNDMETVYSEVAAEIWSEMIREELPGSIISFSRNHISNISKVRTVWALTIEPQEKYRFFNSEEEANAAKILFIY